MQADLPDEHLGSDKHTVKLGVSLVATSQKRLDIK